MKRLLLGLLFASHSIFCFKYGNTEIFLAIPHQMFDEGAKPLVKKHSDDVAQAISQIHDKDEINQKLKIALATREGLLEHCHGQAPDNNCDTLISFFEQIASLYQERLAVLNATQDIQVNSSDVIENIEATEELK